MLKIFRNWDIDLRKYTHVNQFLILNSPSIHEGSQDFGNMFVVREDKFEKSCSYAFTFAHTFS